MRNHLMSNHTLAQVLRYSTFLPAISGEMTTIVLSLGRDPMLLRSGELHPVDSTRVVLIRSALSQLLEELPLQWMEERTWSRIRELPRP